MTRTEQRRLYRSTDDRVVAGVCGGLGDYFDVDPVIFRIAFVVLAFVGGAGFLLYPAAWLLLPEEGHHRSIGESWVQRGRHGHWLAIALIVIGAAVLAGQLSDHHGGGAGFAVVAVVIGVLLLRRHSAATGQPPASPASYPWSPPDSPPPGPPDAAREVTSTEPTAALPPPPETHVW